MASEDEGFVQAMPHGIQISGQDSTGFGVINLLVNAQPVIRETPVSTTAF